MLPVPWFFFQTLKNDSPYNSWRCHTLVSNAPVCEVAYLMYVPWYPWVWLCVPALSKSVEARCSVLCLWNLVSTLVLTLFHLGKWHPGLWGDICTVLIQSIYQSCVTGSEIDKILRGHRSQGPVTKSPGQSEEEQNWGSFSLEIIVFFLPSKSL